MFRPRDGILLLAVAILFTPACDSSPTDNGGCAHHPINPKLGRVLYWGEKENDPGTYVPNSGFHVASMYQPRWVAADTILTLGYRLVAGEDRHGVFKIAVDPVTHAFVSATLFAFDEPFGIWSYDVRHNSNELLLLRSTSSTSRGISKARFSHGELVIDPELIGNEWLPSGARYWPQHGGFVFYGTRPGATSAAFFWMSSDSSDPDSLLAGTGGSFHDVLSFKFSPDGEVLYTASTNYNGYPYKTSLHAHNMSTGADAVLFQGQGEFAGMDVNAAGDRILINRRYDGGPHRAPEDLIDIIDVNTGSAARVDVRTQEADCRWIVALTPSWSPDGSSFAFSAGWASGEGDYAPYALWVRRLR